MDGYRKREVGVSSKGIFNLGRSCWRGATGPALTSHLPPWALPEHPLLPWFLHPQPGLQFLGEALLDPLGLCSWLPLHPRADHVGLKVPVGCKLHEARVWVYFSTQDPYAGLAPPTP